jgi:hypothetical protein
MRIPALTPIQLKNLSKEETENKKAEIHTAIVIVHALLNSTTIYLEFIRHYQFLISNNKFRKKIVNSFDENQLLLNDLNEVFKRTKETRALIGEQDEFSYDLLDKLEAMIKEVTSQEYGLGIEIKEI